MKDLFGNYISDIRQTFIPNTIIHRNYNPNKEKNLFKYDFGNGPVLAFNGPNGPIEVVLFPVDYGTNKSLVILGLDDNPIDFRYLKLPNVIDDKYLHLIVERAIPNVNCSAFDYACPALRLLQKFVWILKQNFGPNKLPVIVTEAATIGSYGIIPKIMHILMQDFLPEQLQIISGKAAIYERKYLGIMKEKDDDNSHVEDARIFKRIAFNQPERLYKWKYRPEKLQRKYTNLTPHNAWNYNDPWGVVDKFMNNAIPLNLLPLNMREFFCEETPNGLRYKRLVVFPILQAMEEDGVLESSTMFRIITSKSEHGYPCHYKETHGNLRERIEKIIAEPIWDEEKNEHRIKIKSEITRQERKAAWKIADHMAMAFYKLCREYRKENFEVTPKLLKYIDDMAKRYAKQQKKKNN